LRIEALFASQRALTGQYVSGPDDAIQEKTMIDHMGFRVADLARSRRFYEACVRALGLQIVDNTPESFLIGRSGEWPMPFIWVGTTNPAFWTPQHTVSASPIHVAFVAPSREAVDAFHKAALEAGGKDNGAPGLRGPKEMGYYAAFALDPDGNNIEAGIRG
jgi:catechol 2,3-dioxygenase-like lactoylglutathione lyase family enzyme